MKNNNMVLFLLVIIVFFWSFFGIMFFQSLNAKEPSKVKIISNKTQYEGDKLIIQLTDITKEQARHAEQVSGYDVKYDYKSGMYVQYNPYNHCYHN